MTDTRCNLCHRRACICRKAAKVILYECHLTIGSTDPSVTHDIRDRCRAMAADLIQKHDLSEYYDRLTGETMSNAEIYAL